MDDVADVNTGEDPGESLYPPARTLGEGSPVCGADEESPEVSDCPPLSKQHGLLALISGYGEGLKLSPDPAREDRWGLSYPSPLRPMLPSINTRSK